MLASVGLQCVSGWALVVRGWRRRTGWVAWLQAASGAGLASFLLVHVASVLYGRSVLGLDTNFYFAAAGLHARSGAWLFGSYYFLAVVGLFTHLGCALAWHVKARSAHARRYVLGAAVLLGAAAAASIVASLAGMTQHVDIPAAYKTREGAAEKIGLEPVFSLTQAEPINGCDNERAPHFESHRREPATARCQCS